jgi:flagellin
MLSYSVSGSERRALTLLNGVSDALARTYERVSSGLRINNTSDDPTGLSLADVIRRDARIANTALRNANDGVSLTAVADNALKTSIELLQKMSELAAQSANEIYTNLQRSSLALEFTALASEVERIAATTEYNKIRLLSASEELTLQVGLEGSTDSRITLTAILGTLSSINLAQNNSSALIYSITDNTTTLAASAAANALMAVNSAVQTLSVRRGEFGATESRLRSSINYLQVARENFLAAESRVRDVDVAEEIAKQVRLEVLQQGIVSVLTQSKLKADMVLELLK